MKTRLQISFLQLTSNNKQAIITKIKCPSTVQRAKRGRIPLSSDGGQHDVRKSRGLCKCLRRKQREICVTLSGINAIRQ